MEKSHLWSYNMRTLESLSVPYESGFDAGDTQRGAQLLRNENVSEIYRIDGKYSPQYFVCMFIPQIIMIVGDCIVPVAMDVCGLNSIPLHCLEAQLMFPFPSACLCNLGYNKSSTCLGTNPRLNCTRSVCAACRLYAI